jgi:hypothetical protein
MLLEPRLVPDDDNQRHVVNYRIKSKCSCGELIIYIRIFFLLDYYSRVNMAVSVRARAGKGE